MDNILNVIAEALLQQGATAVRILDGGVDVKFAGSAFRVTAERAR